MDKVKEICNLYSEWNPSSPLENEPAPSSNPTNGSNRTTSTPKRVRILVGVERSTDLLFY